MKNKLFLLLVLSVISFSARSQEVRKGDLAPEIEMPLISGEDFKLSDLRGKMVLIDFWAAWCKPCRKENPNVVNMYHKYKDESFKNGEGFTVVSVSLDFSHKLWEDAISKDKLEWPYHISDMKGWKNDAAVAYDVHSIPTNFLIDGDGKVVAIHLKGENLDKKLRKQLKKK